VPLAIDGKLTEEWLVEFIREEMQRRRFNCAVIGVSGGVDSAVTAYLAAKALGPDWKSKVAPIGPAGLTTAAGKLAALPVGSTFAGNLWILAKSWVARDPAYPRLTIARLGEIPVGGVKLFKYPGPQDQCLLVRTGDDAYVAYSQKCTHLSCAVYYERETSRLACPCHQGFFSIADGRPLQGPPSRPLPKVALQQKDGQLIAIRMVEGEEA